jgi:hypothetical protein
MKFILTPFAAIAMMICAAQPAAAAQRCGAQEMYSASMKQCIPRSIDCKANQVYSSSMGRCIPKSLGR